MKMAFEYQMFLDMYEDTASAAQSWTNHDLKLTIDTATQSWAIPGKYAIQWQSLRYHSDTKRVSVVVRADKQARTAILKNSGKALVYSREPQSEGATEREYVAIWLQANQQRGTPQGIVTATYRNFPNSWGLCRNSRSYGIRADKKELAAVRSALRPADAALNEANKQIDPKAQWILKGVSPQATAQELAESVCKVWLIIPVRQLSVRKNRAVWLVESEQDPPTAVLNAAQSIILVERFQEPKKPKYPNRGKGSQKGKEGFVKGDPQGKGQDDWSSYWKTTAPSTATSSTSSASLATRPFKSKGAHSGADPLQGKDPWSSWQSKAVTQDKSQVQTDPLVLQRLKQAEDAITRIEKKQDATDGKLGQMQDFMSSRFEQVMGALEGLKQDPSKRARMDADGRGGRQARIAAANVTSFAKHWRELFDLNLPAVFLTETLIHSSDHWIEPTTKAFQKKLHVGAPCIITGALHARKGGVAVLVNEDTFTVVNVPVPDYLQQPYQEARAMQVVLGAKHSELKIKATVYYGKTGEYDANAAEVGYILDAMADTPDQAMLLAGDLNLPDSHPIWERVRAQGTWHDIHLSYMDDQVPQPTCWPTNAAPSRLDYLIVNNQLRACVREAGHCHQTTMPVHIPIYASIDLEPKSLPMMVLPKPIPTSRRLPEPALDQDFIVYQDLFQNLLLQGHMQEAYQLWSAHWERALLAEAANVHNPEKHQGRGRVPRIKYVPPRSPRKPAQTDEEARLRNFLGRIREYQRLRDKQGVYAHQLVDKIIRQAPHVMRIYGPPEQTTGDVMEDLALHVGGALHRERQRASKESKDIWKARIMQAGGQNRTLAQAIRADADNMLRTIRKENNMPVMNVAEIVEELSQHWDRIHMLEEGDVQGWIDRFGEYLPMVPEPELPEITAQDIKGALDRMKKHTARGADGWTNQELVALPQAALEQIALSSLLLSVWGNGPACLTWF